MGALRPGMRQVISDAIERMAGPADGRGLRGLHAADAENTRSVVRDVRPSREQ